MNRLRILTCNHLEPLVEHLVDRLAADPLDPWTDEVLVVQSHGMARWLTLQLARRQGIAAGIEMPFPGAWAFELAGKLQIPGAEPDEEVDPFDPTSLTWRLHEIFAGLETEVASDGHALDPVRLYLEHDADGRKRYQLAARVAGLFQQYQLHRPDMLADWQRRRVDESSNATWQAELWKRLVAGARRPLSDILIDLRDRLRAGEIDTGALPKRISVFGVPTLAPLLVEVLAALSLHTECALYVVTPTPEYWTDLRSEAELQRRALRAGEGFDPEIEHWEVAHPLLGSMGRQGREFLSLLNEIDESGQALENLADRAPAAESLLGRIQADVLELLDPETEERADWDPADRSLRLHVCHSPMREMEVLREEILRAFEDGIVDEPGDVLLLVPDIAEYAPYVQAVFGRRAPTEDGEELSLPFGLADRHPRDEEPYARVMLQLLDLAAGRRGRSEVFDLIEQPPVARKFGLDPAELPSLRAWLRDAGVRWGENAQQRARDAQVPEFEGATWREGLDRLLLGAMTGPVEALVTGRLPLADATWGRTETLAALAEGVDAIFAQLERLREDQSLSAWTAHGAEALLALTVAESENEQLQRQDTLAALQRLAERATRFELGAITGRGAFREALEVELGEAAADRGFISGGITVAELRPMRSLPFPLILLAGLDDQRFPRTDRPLGFDLMAQHRRRGDRRAADDDRYLFLETLLAAERRLVLTHVGRSQHDNRELGRSVCVEELLDLLDRRFQPREGTSAAHGVVVQHALQPTDPSLLDAKLPETFTYDASLAAAVRARAKGAVPLPAFVDAKIEPHPEEKEPTEEILLADLLRFWRNPARWYCENTLGMRLRRDEDEEHDRESFELDGLQKWRARDWLLQRRAAGRPVDTDELDLLRPLAAMPPGAVGQLQARGLQRDIAERWRELHGTTQSVDPLDVDLRVGDARLRGTLGPMTSLGLRILRAGSMRAVPRLHAWIGHLVLCSLDAAQRRDLPAQTVLSADDKSFVYDAVSDADSLLARLVAGFHRGQSEPLPFYASTSEAFAAEGEGETLEIFRRQRVRAQWNPPRGAFAGRTADAEDDAVGLVVRGLGEEEIASEPFADWARAIWLPLRAHENKWKGDAS